LATVGSDGLARLWGVRNGEPLARVDGRSPRLNCVAFSPDGESLVAVASNDNNIRLWELSELLSPTSSASPTLVSARFPAPAR
jgi:WD40 repeat protein